MLFNSFEFLIFLPCVFAAYWALSRHLRLQNLLVLATSYLFYGWWDWRFLSLIAFTSAWSYCVGLVELRRWDERPSKALLAVSLIVNLGILGYFKYCGFFVDSFASLLQDLHLLSSAGAQSLARLSLNVVLPVGISFYTFQALSYTIDVYRREVRPTRDPIAFFAFIAFFPQLVAGPIERASNLLPQFLRAREFSYEKAVDGCRQMLWGFFKKCVVADNCAVVVDLLLNDSSMTNGLGVWLGMVLFAVQIYGDFSGYSDIAIGVSRLFGVDLMRNFAYPFFARDIAEFWRRWHMSLTTVRDIPRKRTLARRELDVHPVGRLPRASVPSASPRRTQPPPPWRDRRRANASRPWRDCEHSGHVPRRAAWLAALSREERGRVAALVR